jgi:hypothetical protein
MHPIMTDLLLEEYVTLTAELGPDPSPEQLTAALVQNADWTPQGAAIVVHLAQTHGTFLLRNALALAHALGIEDGENGI